jgi:hypothetical protein
LQWFHFELCSRHLQAMPTFNVCWGPSIPCHVSSGSGLAFQRRFSWKCDPLEVYTTLHHTAGVGLSTRQEWQQRWFPPNAESSWTLLRCVSVLSRISAIWTAIVRTNVELNIMDEEILIHPGSFWVINKLQKQSDSANWLIFPNEHCCYEFSACCGCCERSRYPDLFCPVRIYLKLERGLPVHAARPYIDCAALGVILE